MGFFSNITFYKVNFEEDEHKFSFSQAINDFFFFFKFSAVLKNAGKKTSLLIYVNKGQMSVLQNSTYHRTTFMPQNMSG